MADVSGDLLGLVSGVKPTPQEIAQAFDELEEMGLIRVGSDGRYRTIEHADNFEANG